MKCVVIGAGPVGALTALYAAERGWDVEIYELRGDLRDAVNTSLNFTKSINMALSERGINAIRSSGSTELLDEILAQAVPMYGRMVHGQDADGRLTEVSQLYDVHGQFIRAVDRGMLNRLLLDKLEDRPNVTFYFNHKLTGVDYIRRRAWIEKRGPSRRESSVGPDPRASGRPGRPDEIEISFDLLCGCDGAHSSARFHMMKFARLDYAQRYIDTLWCEFHIPGAKDTLRTLPSATDGFATSPNHLHIWPGVEDLLMFIAIPNVDKSFTCTLFAPAHVFAHLEADANHIIPYFRKHFPGLVDLIGPDEIQRQFRRSPHLPLISVKCKPHIYGSCGVILGDAAHAMVPFYGQGMNAGLEDVRVLFTHLDAYPDTRDGRARALHAYNQERIPDTHAINDLSLANYWEMQTGVRDRLYLLRKRVEEFLADKVPRSGFATQYSRVSFSNQRYSDLVRVVARQKQILLNGLTGSAVIAVTGTALLIWMHARGRLDVWGGLRQLGSQVGRFFGR